MGILIGVVCTAPAAPGHLPQSTANASHASAAAYEADEVAMLRSIAGQARWLAGGQPVCIDLHLRGHLPNAVSLARQGAQAARQARSSGFERIERALARHGGRAATADRDLDGRELIGAAGVGRSLLAERCPAPAWVTFWRIVQSGEAALVSASLGSQCSSGSLFIALRKRGRNWLIEGEYSQIIPGAPPGCGQAYRGEDAPAGRYLVIGE